MPPLPPSNRKDCIYYDVFIHTVMQNTKRSTGRRRKYSIGNSDYMALKVENVTQCRVGVQSSENKSETNARRRQFQNSFSLSSS